MTDNLSIVAHAFISHVYIMYMIYSTDVRLVDTGSPVDYAGETQTREFLLFSFFFIYSVIDEKQVFGFFY